MIVGYRSSELYAVFPVGRAVFVKLQAQRRDGGARSGIDLSDVKWEIRLRFAPRPLTSPATFDRDYVMEKVQGKAAPGDTGVAQVLVDLPTARECLHVEWVAVDTTVLRAGTPSGKFEWALDLPWLAAAVATPSP